MSIRINISEGNQALPTAGANVIARLGVSSAGTDNGVTEWDPGSGVNVPDELGYGPLVEGTARGVDVAGEHSVAVKVPATIDAVLGDVTHLDADGGNSPTGPTVTVDGEPLGRFTLRAKVAKAGDLGVAKMRIALDGYTYGPEVDLPAELPASIRGTVNLMTVTLADLNGLTVIANPDGGGNETTTLTTPSSIQDIADQINATGDTVARIIAGRYLQLEGVDVGSGGSLVLGAGTANATLGLSGVASAGSVTSAAGPYDLEHGDTLVVAFETGGNQSFSIAATAASRQSGNTETFALSNGDTLTVKINRGGVQTITFATADFVDIANATAEEVAAAINAQIFGASAAATTSGTKVTIKSDRRGTGSYVEVTGGAANVALGFSTSEIQGTGNVSNVDAVTASEWASILSGLTNGTAAAVGGALKLQSATTGTSSTVQVQSSSTADDEMGFDNAVHAGSDSSSVAGIDSSYEVPKTGLTLHFPSGTYVLDETYTTITVEPRFAIEDALTALDALRESGVAFGVALILQDPVDGADSLEWAQALDTKIASWHNAESERIFPVWVMGTSLGGTGAAAIETNDLDVRTAMAVHESRYGVMAHGDWYQTGQQWVGSHRASLAIPLAERFASGRISADPGNGAFPPIAGGSMVGPDGETLARDENFAVIKMATRGFCTAIRRDKKPRFKGGATRAASTSKFTFPGVLRAAYLAAFAVYNRALQFENADVELTKDGTIREAIAAAVDKVFEQDLVATLVKEGHASAVTARVDRSQVADEQGKYPLVITWQMQMKGQVRDVIGTLSVVTELTLS